LWYEISILKAYVKNHGWSKHVEREGTKIRQILALSEDVRTKHIAGGGKKSCMAKNVNQHTPNAVAVTIPGATSIDQKVAIETASPGDAGICQTASRACRSRPKTSQAKKEKVDVNLVELKKKKTRENGERSTKIRA